MARYTTTLMDILKGELQKRGFNEFVNDGNLTFNDKSYAFIQKILRFDEDVKDIVDDVIFQGFRFNDERIDRYFKQSFVTRFLDREINRQTVEAFGTQVLHYTIIREDYIFTVFGSELYKYLENHVDYNADQTGNTVEDETQNQTNEQTQNQNNEETQNETQNQNNTSNTDTNNQNVSSDRELTSSLPQSEINLDVDNDILLYGDSNTISKNKTTNDGNEKTTGESDSTGETTTTGKQDSTMNASQDSTRNTNQDSTSNQKSLSKTYLLENLDKIYTMRERLYNDYDKKCFLQIW